jgi:hypothetical protein
MPPWFLPPPLGSLSDECQQALLRGVEAPSKVRVCRAAGMHVLVFLVYANRNYWTTTSWEDDAVPDPHEGEPGG